MFTLCSLENLPVNSDKNGLWIETQTLACIIEGGGDVAFLNTFHIKQYIGKQRKHFFITTLSYIVAFAFAFQIF